MRMLELYIYLMPSLRALEGIHAQVNIFIYFPIDYFHIIPLTNRGSDSQIKPYGLFGLAVKGIPLRC